MNTDPQPAAPTAPVVTAALQTYEDCLAAVKSGDNETNVDNLKATLRKLAAFFEQRMAKKKRGDDRDGFGATKAALEGSRTFSKFQPKQVDDKPGPSPLT